jgi:ribosomal protein S27AE
MAESKPSRDVKGVDSATSGFDGAARTPETPSERAEWDQGRHGEALEFHRQQNRRSGMDEVARRNQYCPKCRGVVDWKAEACPHCGAPIPPELRDYYNFSDFEPPVDRRDLAPILTIFAVGVVVAGLVVWGVIALVRALV